MELSRRERYTMREEVYRVKRPGYIVFGNPDYYGKQEYKGNIKSYSPANSFDTRVILYESGPQKKAMRSMSVCFIHRALNTEIRESKCTLKIRRHTELLPHGEKILIEIDGKWDEINVDPCEWCGEIQKFFRSTKQKTICEAVILTIRLPRSMDYPAMKKMAEYYFQNMELVRRVDGPDAGYKTKGLLDPKNQKCYKYIVL